MLVIQTKASRLGMYLMGQAFYSAPLIHDSTPVQSFLWYDAAKMIPGFGRCLSPIPT
jgi:hypothetical protein